MGIEPQAQQQSADLHEQTHGSAAGPHEVDGLKHKKPEDLTPQELRLMADTMPGDGPGD
ncbi:hypothetical protein [Massilia sp. H6]|uniref:hypothetical protein n=1 Tax=Massilia sp. H6 TaxID=2970464 RepID=UPI002169F31C|nr:hypothetical protein [Massilia sp. H6]UVW27806.1 hypothetical protein NRS07_14805 [Massilia sp. H6]